MAKNLIDESKAWLPQFYANGEFIDNPQIKFNGRYLENDIVMFISDFFKFLIDSDFLNNCTLIWLKSNLPSVQKTFEFYNSQCDIEDIINIKTAQSKIDYDKKKLKKYYDSNLLFNVMAFPNQHLSSARETLDILTRQYFNDKVYRDNLVIKLPKDVIRKDISDAAFDRMIDALAVYSKKRVQKIESLEDEVLTKEMIGYYNFLISNHRLDEEGQTRLNKLRETLGIE